MNAFRISAAICAFLFALPYLTAAQKCSSIATVDFQNSTIQLKHSPGLVDEEFRFRNGVFDEMDPKPHQNLVEWHFAIVDDIIVQPSPDASIRFVEISGEHLRGTGTRNIVIGFRCLNGFVVKVFQQAAEVIDLVSASPNTVILSFAVWKQSDPHCCPSQEKRVWYIWEAPSGTYKEQRAELKPRITQAH